MSSSKKLFIILIITFFASYISLPKLIPIRLNFGFLKINKDIIQKDINLYFLGKLIKKTPDLKLGLDLAGGSRLVFEADAGNLSNEEKDTALKSIRDIIEKRVNFFGVSEPNIQILQFENKDRIVVELPGIENTKEAINLIGKTAQLNFAEIGNKDNPEFKKTNLAGADLKSARVVFEQTTSKPAVSLVFTEEGGEKFLELTKNNIGKPLAIMLDDEIISTPFVQSEISGGQAQITGDFSLDEAENLSIQLNAGALPVPIELIEQKTIGATLGYESIGKSVKAGLVGLLMVVLFMVLLYGKFGVVAVFSLYIFAVITLSLYKLIPVVLTLPGIAGFLLSVGMAVDSNILIFERFKEERKKRKFNDALEVSFGKAWDSIRDANIATIATAFILANPLDWNFLHTSGPVRGFAITLFLGILVSLFTGVYVTRNLLRVFIKN